MKRNKVIVKLQGCWIQKTSGKGYYHDGALQYERLVIGKGSLVRETTGLEVRQALMGVSPLEAVERGVRISIAKQVIEFIACAHVRMPKLRSVVENALGVDRRMFSIRVVKC